MYAVSTTLAFFLLCAQLTFAQKNITVVDTDPSIHYSGGAGDATICKVDASGNFISGQAGCYSVPDKCTDSVAMGQSKDSGASFTFKGSAIYINSLLFSLSPLYTVTLDGTAVDVDGFRTSKAFSCETLFSRTGLDPTSEHTISLAIKGVSPNSTDTSDGIFDFSLINFIYTTEDSATSSNTSSNTPPASSTPTNTSSAPATSNTTTTSNDTKSSSGTSLDAISGLRSMDLGFLSVVILTLVFGADLL
ncbi:hypothetical protein BDN70DRAFT_924330 [Pholiota conissans]|uniref:Uncharacterized protein n=1 Tax=Pholiota conissans TaxID=109636 RepID=A0A9P5YVZ2_9AGAR|nr:hypothetical protein BDN70DRAFT_924330 [Pholiota conissans]